MSKCDNVPDYIVLPNQGGGLPGPPGPPGPQGPPGIGQLPVPAKDVSVTNSPFTTAQEVFDFLLYTPLVVSNFRTNPNIFEIGSTITSAKFTWAYNKAVAEQFFIAPSGTTQLLSTDREFILAFPTPLGATTSFTLRSDDGVIIPPNSNSTPVDTATSIQFLNGVYWGDEPPPAVLDSAFILRLSKKLQTNRRTTYSSQAGAGEYNWFANPVRFGIATFVAGGFTGGFQAPIIVPFTNASGFTEDYYVYQSDNPNIGPVNIVVN